MKCPTCEHAKENMCCQRGKEIPKEEQIIEEDPYASEIDDNYDKHLQCKKCIENSCDEI